MDDSADVALDNIVNTNEEVPDDDIKENKVKQSTRRSSKRGRAAEVEELDGNEIEEPKLQRSARRVKKTKPDDEEPEEQVQVVHQEVEEEAEPKKEAEPQKNGTVEDNINGSEQLEMLSVEEPAQEENAQPQIDGDTMESQNDDDVVEVSAPEKDKPEMIVLDDIDNDDDGPGPDEVPTAEERGFWKAVEENPNDFASWTYLLQVVEKNGKLKQIQKAFTSFLALYPYCYGYWKKYADQMKKLVSNEAAFQVYNDAVVSIPLSVDLWTYFIHFIAEWKDGDESEIRTIYQRAVEACGQDYRSDKIWEAYVEWEKQTDKYRVLKLYKQFLGCIIQRHQYHFDKYREWIFFTPVKDMVTMEDIKELLTRHKAEAERRRIETEKKIKEEEERARKAAEEAAKLAEEQRKQAEEEEAKIQEDIRRMQDEQKRAAMGEEGEEAVQDVDMEGVEEPAPVSVPEITEEPEEEKQEAPVEEEVPVEVEEEATVEKEEEEEEKEAPVVVELVEEETSDDVVKQEIQPVEQMTEDFNKVDMEEPLPDSPDALTAKQEAAIREQMLLDMAPIHEKILAEIEEVAPFEDGIKRPYFHVKELERVQLKNWKNYLNLVTEKKDTARTITLFERCLIACAFYEGFWIKYINFMTDIDKEETSRIYRRACMVHLVKKPQIHLNWAAFEEDRGQLEVAREALDHMDKAMPGLIAVILRRSGLERRCGNIEQGGDIVKGAVENCRGRETRDFWIMKYMSYLQYTIRDVTTARQFLLDQIERNPRNKRLYVRLLDLEHSPDTKYPDPATIVGVFDKALTSSLSIEEKAGFSHRRLTFLEEFGDDIGTIIAAYEDHNKNWKAVLDDKKRDTQLPNRDYRRRDNYNNYNRNYNRDRGYNNRDRNYNNNQSNYNNQNNSYNAGFESREMGDGEVPRTVPTLTNMNYNMQQQAQQQQYQQWYSQYAQQQQQQYASQGQQYPAQQPTRGY